MGDIAVADEAAGSRFRLGEWAERGGLLLIDIGATLVAAVAAGWRSALVLACLSAVGLAVGGLYRRRLILSALDDLFPVIVAVGAAWTVAVWVAGRVAAPRALPLAALWWWLIVACCIVLARSAVYVALRRRRARWPETVVIVGSGPVGVRLAAGLLEEPQVGLRPVGLLGPPPRDGESLPVPSLGPVAAFDEGVDGAGVQNVIVGFGGVPDAELVDALRLFRQRGRTVFVVPRLFELNVRSVGAELVAGVPLVRLPPVPAHRWTWYAKRPLDVLGALLALVLVAPLALASVLALRREVGREGVLFRQKRVGRHGRWFRMLKLRSLTPASRHSPLWTVRRRTDGDAHGPVERCDRRTSRHRLVGRAAAGRRRARRPRRGMGGTVRPLPYRDAVPVLQLAGVLVAGVRPARELRLALVRMDGRLVAAAALMACRRGPWRLLVPIGGELSDFHDVLVDDSYAAQACRMLADALRREPGWHALDIPEARSGAAAEGLYAAWDGPRWRAAGSACFEIPAGSPDQFLAGLHGSTAKKLRSKLRKVDRHGIEARDVPPSGTEDAVRALIGLHRRQWRGRGINPEHLQARFERHLTRATSRMTGRGQAALVQ